MGAGHELCCRVRICTRPIGVCITTRYFWHSLRNEKTYTSFGQYMTCRTRKRIDCSHRMANCDPEALPQNSELKGPLDFTKNYPNAA